VHPAPRPTRAQPSPSTPYSNPVHPRTGPHSTPPSNAMQPRVAHLVRHVVVGVFWHLPACLICAPPIPTQWLRTRDNPLPSLSRKLPEASLPLRAPRSTTQHCARATDDRASAPRSSPAACTAMQTGFTSAEQNGYS
jgi:hypothetical protein